MLASTDKGGVNFRQRLHAEAHSVFLCVEHHVLSDEGWRAFLDRAAEHSERRGRRPQFVAAVERARRQLAVQLEASRRKGKKRTGRARRRRLETQMERLEAWLGEGGTGEDADPACEAFAPFFPLLGVWDEV